MATLFCDSAQNLAGIWLRYPSLQFLHVAGIELDHRLAPVDRDRHLEAPGGLVDLGDGSAKCRERAAAHPHQLLDPQRRRPRHSFSTWPNSSSTGVARPKIDTATLSRERLSSTSSTVPLNEANGPSDTRTCSPTSKDTAGFGRSMPSATWLRMRCASASEIGIGLLSAPRKPVTFGVFLIR